MRSARLWTVVALSLPLAACDDHHTGASEGITFFDHPDYDGDSITLAGGFSDFDDLRGPCGVAVDGASGDWDNCISSIRVRRR